MEDFPGKLTKKLADRRDTNALRTLKQADKELVDLFSNDYLGLASNDEVYDMASRLAAEAGDRCNGATGSRLLSGNHPLYEKLETLLSRVYEGSALVFNSGYDANAGFFSSVPQRGDVVLYDEYIHASIRDGIHMGRANGYKFAHNNLEVLASLIKKHRQKENRDQITDDTALQPEVYVVTESVFSMDGESPDLHALCSLCKENNCRLVVDEAHAVGVAAPSGKGLLQVLGLHLQTFARIITFGKAMGAHGAAVLGSGQLRTYLLNFARSFVYTTALPPHSVATILAAYEFAASRPGLELHAKLRENIRIFKKELGLQGLQDIFTQSDSAIQCCIMPGNERVKAASETLVMGGFDVRPILSPTVPAGLERLRFCLHSHNSGEDIRKVLQLLATFVHSI